MRRAVLVGTGVAVVVLVGRRAVPVLAARCLKTCGRFMSQMPDSFPPKRMAAELARIRDQNEEILRILEGGARGETPGVDDTSG